MITKTELIKCSITAVVLCIFCYGLPDFILWAKSKDWLTLSGIFELGFTAIIIIAFVIFVKARFDKVDTEFESRKQKLKDDLRKVDKWK